MADKTVDIGINAQDKTGPAFASVRKNLQDTGKGVDALKGAFSALGALAGVAGVGQLLTEAVAAARQAEDSEKRLGALLKANGDTAGYTRDQLEGMVDALYKSTQFDDEDIRGAQAQLVKFGNIHSEVFKQALQYSADYAALIGGSMTDAAQVLGTAFADPIQGATMLERQIGKLTATEDAQIKTAMEAGRADEARAVLAAKLEKTIGGLAETMNTDLTGAITGAGKSWDNLMEAFGRAAPTKILVEGAFGAMKNSFDIVREAMEKANKEAERSIFFKGQLKPLPVDPNAVGPNRGDLGLPKDMTTADVLAGGRADRAKMDEDERLRAEKRAKGAAAAASAAEKRDKEKFASFVALQERQAQVEIAAAENMAKLLAEKEKEAVAARESLNELGAMIEASRAQQEMATAETLDFDRQIAETRDAIAKQQLIGLLDDLATEREIEMQHYAEQNRILVEGLANNSISLEDAAQRDARIRDRHQKRLTSLDDAEIKKRTGTAVVYRKIDLESAGFFFDQLSGMMNSKSRKMFEIGKAAAIVGAVIDTYKAATGAYAALASIPYVGPALGVAAAAAAIVAGMARVQAIKSTSFGSAGGGAVGTYSASPTTGLPETGPGTAPEAPQSAIAPAARSQNVLNLNVQFVGSGRYTQSEIIDGLGPALNEWLGDGGRLNVKTQ